MYLARKFISGKCRYFIRESYREGKDFGCRDLFDLGADPGKFIAYPGGNAFYIDETVEDEIRSQGVEPSMEDMEAVFWRFLRPEIRIKLEPFRRRERRQKDGRKKGDTSDLPDAHVFDTRRIHFLKTGRMDQRSLDHLPKSALRRLQGKSRDEIEQGFMEMESVLRPREYKAYTYVIFNLQHFFHQQFAKDSPQFLDQDQVDAYFIEEVCRLNRDSGFWAGMNTGNRLSEYLVRYLVMYFDHDYASRSFAADYVRDFMNRHRTYQPPPSVTVSMQEICAIFGKSREALKKMSRRDLWRLYRRRARDLHPDTGGDHERFVKLNDAYHKLLRVIR